MIIQTKHLTKAYKNQTVVDDVSLHVRKGRIYGLLGRNGAGKTTIMKMIMGLTSITKGSISLFDRALPGNEKSLYPRIGSVIELPGFYPDLTGTENLQVFSRIRGTISRYAVRDTLELMGLPYHDKKPFSRYSLGMKQRLGIANAMVHDPELLILDEPTNGLDPAGITEIRSFIRTLASDRQKTILISSHILSEISLLADDIGILHEGSLLEESPLAELEQKNRRYIELEVESSDKAAFVLEHHLHLSDYQVISDHYIHIFKEDLPSAVLNKKLVDAGIPVISLHVSKESLENHFMKITGGEADV